MGTINVSFKQVSNSYDAHLKKDGEHFHIKKEDKGGTYYDTYKGEYVVTPLAFEETILETTDKVMKDDVTVLEIPYFETSNLKGTTVYIANQI